MGELKIFENADLGNVRVVEVEGQPWFVAKDVIAALGYAETSNPARLFQAVPDEWKGVNPIHTLGGGQEMITLSEQGLYFFLGRSDKPKALPYQKWVAGEVVPSIRKHGVYATDNVIEQILNNPQFGIDLLTKLKEERQARLEAEKTVNILTHVNKTYTATEVAKECGMKSAIQLNKLLNDKGVQFHQNGTWVPYSKYSQLGWFEIKQEVLDSGRIIYHRRITGIGRKSILDMVMQA